MVGIHNVVIPGKGRHQHNKGAFRQVKIGDESIDALPLVAGIDKYFSIITALVQPFAGNIGRLQRTTACCPYCNNPMACAFRFIDKIRRFL